MVQSGGTSCASFRTFQCACILCLPGRSKAFGSVRAGLSDALRPCSARLLHQGALLHGSTLEAHGLASGDRVKLVVPPRSQRTDVDSSEQATNTPDSAHTAHFSGQRRVQAALATDARGASQRKLETELAAAKHDAESLRKALGRAEALRQALAEDLKCLREEVRALSAKRTTAAAEQLQQAGKEAAELQATLQATQQELSAARASAVSADALLWWTRHAAELTAKASAMLAAFKTEAAVVKRAAPKLRCKVDREEERAVRAECRRERQRERAEKCQKRQGKVEGGHKPKSSEAGCA